ncbi:MAG TPA: hypothetical protein VNO25_17315 [Streptosporangiaceae bacterium]|nr:hypothetical protein [Streptosporangiaceae bacterium]
MHGLIADGAGGAWTFGGSILTFAFPMILFIVVAGALYVLYTKPESVPGHRAPGLQRSVSYTAVPGKAEIGHEAQALAAAKATQARPAAAGTAGIITGAAAQTPAAETTSGEAARAEDAE